ncbi:MULTISPECIES: hypothetical protein [unclassified Roseovarius]|uniref:hypothetical protein n=1 Tax=unclassified Roseovarius TaxID=2614913 RepID=UPI00273E5C3C|nr:MULTISPECIES: hypothetical protein [unclassified Roseovarius]
MKSKRRISRVFYYEGLSLGLLLGSIVFGFFELSQRFFNGQSWVDSPWLVLFPAFLAAYVTLQSISEQSRLAQDLDIEKNDQLERMARADLPLSISVLKNLCDKALKWHFDSSEPFPDWSEFESPLEKLRGTIAYSEKETAEYLLRIIRHYQVLFARGRELNAEVCDAALNDPANIAHNEHWYSAINWAVLSAMVEKVFPYARGKDQSICTEPVNERVRSQFFDIVHFWDDFPFLDEAMKLREEEDRFEMSF